MPGVAGAEVVVPPPTKLNTIICRRFFEKRPLDFVEQPLTLSVKPVSHHRVVSKRPRDETTDGTEAENAAAVAAASVISEEPSVIVNGIAVTPSRGVVQLVGKRGVWDANESLLLFYDQLHLKSGWMLARKVPNMKRAILATVIAKHVDDDTQHSGSSSRRWSRHIGRAAVVTPGEVLEIIDVSVSRQ